MPRGHSRQKKSYTSRHLRLEIEANDKTSRREWMMWMFKRAGLKNERNKDFQFWIQNNHPIELNTSEIMIQRLNYIHNNPVEAGFVEKAEDWLHSSAGDYYGMRKSKVDLIIIE